MSDDREWNVNYSPANDALLRENENVETRESLHAQIAELKGYLESEKEIGLRLTAIIEQRDKEISALETVNSDLKMSLDICQKTILDDNRELKALHLRISDLLAESEAREERAREEGFNLARETTEDSVPSIRGKKLKYHTYADYKHALEKEAHD
jgi:hypothetical protein